MNFEELPRSLVSLRPRADTLYVSQGGVVIATNRDGLIDADADEGVFARQTRFISRLHYRIDGLEPEAIALSSIEQNSWMGYYALEVDPDTGEFCDAVADAEQVVEMRVTRQILGGVHEDVDLTNYTEQPISLNFAIDLDADFADISETKGERRQHGDIARNWKRTAEGVYRLSYRYQAEHDWEHQGNSGTSRIDRRVDIEITNADSPPVFDDGTLVFSVSLAPKQSWHTCLRFSFCIEGDELRPQDACGVLPDDRDERQQRRHHYLENSAAFSIDRRHELAAQVIETVDRATRDLAALRMYDFDTNERAWIVAAGMPLYSGIFGRDTLTTSWQAALSTSDMMEGTLAQLAKRQATGFDDWRDAQPGRMPHQCSPGPLNALDYEPFDCYYGTLTASDFYPFVVAELWHWTGDMERVAPFIDPAVEAIEWLLEHGDSNDDGIFDYKTRSEQGIKNQGWKDSSDAIIYEDGSIVPDPIATCEEQGFAFAAMLSLSEVLWWADRKSEAKRLYKRAFSLKERFNEAFWMPEHDYLAMALDPDGEQVRSIASNAGHCLASGILDEARIPPVAERLMSDELFSGWGIRTLSKNHIAFNPYSYHRGSVWPAEHGSYAVGFSRCGLHDKTNELCRALFETASLYEYNRLPEVLSGHPRDEKHPFPALYPKANWPQAWSASTAICALQAMLGVYPYAPLNMLVVDPHLPEWLPEITVENLTVGDAHISMRFFRKDDGSSDYQIEDLQGKLHVVRQPSPWSLTTSFAERAKDLLMSLRPG